ncbi:MAG: 2-pyrone-4,6-dicarboxylate lactonase [Alphaproteobacteria bacterium]|nr:2-pyrone-4,6-dicarboxylate lactonase [Alphaproteobacteria bacterium]
MQKEVLPQWVRDTRAPVPLPPPNSTDCQFHIYGDPNKYPPKKDAFYDPPDATFEHMQGVLKTLGFSRGVIVYPMPYDTDTRLLVDTLEGLGAEGRKNFRATCIIKDHVPDTELERLDTLGVVAARFNIGRRYEQVYTREEVKRSIDRAREMGWHARLHVGGDDIESSADFLDSIKGITVAVDHMAHLHFEGGTDQPACQWLVDKLKNDGWWLMLSNGNRDSRMESGYDDAVPFGKMFVEAAPDRMIWGTDWPHVNWRKKRMMNEAETVELLYRYVDNDRGLLQKILVDNPARLHGFQD